MKKIILGILSLLIMGSVYAQSVAQDSTHTIVIKNSSSVAISVQDAGGECMGGTVMTSIINPNETAGAFQVHAKFACPGSAYHQFEIVDQNNHSLGYILVNRPGETFNTQVTLPPPGSTPSRDLSLNATGDEWVFEVLNK